MDPTYFSSSEAWRAWLAEHHASARELWVGFRKVHSGVPSLTWAEAVDEALCFGWIDGIRRRVDDSRYTIRFTPRKPTSTWSVVNIRRVGELERMGRMQPAGLAAFARRRLGRTGLYSHEQRPEQFPEPYLSLFRAEEQAWRYFESQPPSYRRAAIWWVISARQDATRDKRMALLMADSAESRRLRMLDRNAGK